MVDGLPHLQSVVAEIPAHDLALVCGIQLRGTAQQPRGAAISKRDGGGRKAFVGLLRRERYGFDGLLGGAVLQSADVS